MQVPNRVIDGNGVPVDAKAELEIESAERAEGAVAGAAAVASAGVAKAASGLVDGLKGSASGIAMAGAMGAVSGAMGNIPGVAKGVAAAAILGGGLAAKKAAEAAAGQSKSDGKSVLGYEDKAYGNPDVSSRVNETLGSYKDPDESKYRLCEDDSVLVDGFRLYRIEATRDIELSDGTVVKAGEKGGYVESHATLSSEGNCWVAGEAKAWGEARISGDALLKDSAEASRFAVLKDEAVVGGEARVLDSAVVCDRGTVGGSAVVSDKARVAGDATVSGRATLEDEAMAAGKATITDDVRMTGHARVLDSAIVSGNAQLRDYATVSGEAHVYGDTLMADMSCVTGRVSLGTDGSVSKSNSALQDRLNEFIGFSKKDPGIIYLSGDQKIDVPDKNLLGKETDYAVFGSMTDLKSRGMLVLSGSENEAVTAELEALAAEGNLKSAFAARADSIGKASGLDASDAREDAPASNGPGTGIDAAVDKAVDSVAKAAGNIKTALFGGPSDEELLAGIEADGEQAGSSGILEGVKSGLKDVVNDRSAIGALAGGVAMGPVGVVGGAVAGKVVEYFEDRKDRKDKTSAGRDAILGRKAEAETSRAAIRRMPEVKAQDVESDMSVEFD